MEKIFILKPVYVLGDATSSKINFNHYQRVDSEPFEFRGTRLLDYKKSYYYEDMFLWYKSFLIKEVYEKKEHAGSVLFIFYDNSYLYILYGSGIRIISSSIGNIIY